MSAAPSFDADPYDPVMMADPYPVYDAMRRAGPMVWLQRYGVYFVTRHALARTLLMDPTVFSSAQGIGLIGFATGHTSATPSPLLETDPPEHDRFKKVMSRLVGPATLQRLRASFERSASAILEPLLARGRFDAARDLVTAFTLNAIADAVGLPGEDRWQMLVFGELALASAGPRNANFEAALARVQAEGTMDWVQRASERGNLAPDGLGQQLYAAADAGEITTAEAQRLVRIFPTAAVDSTITTLTNGLYELATRPQQWAQLREDPGRSRDAFEEMLRHRVSVQTVYRTATRDVEVEGIAIRAGQRIGICFGAANRDPERWEDPDRFDIRRRPVGHLGFGGGVHACLGQMVARLEAEVLLKALASRVASLRLDGVPARRLNNALSSYAELPVTVQVA